jgi:hypothetical protein
MTSEALLVLNWTVVILGNGLLVGSCVFAWLNGRPAERYGALVYFVSALLDLPIILITHKTLPIEQELFIDGLAAVGFLFLAVRYNSLWLGAVMMLKGVQLALHASHLTEGADLHIGKMNVYAVALDAVAFLISMALIGGTMASMRARRKASGAQPRPSGNLEDAPPQAA